MAVIVTIVTRHFDKDVEVPQLSIMTISGPSGNTKWETFFISTVVTLVLLSGIYCLPLTVRSQSCKLQHIQKLHGNFWQDFSHNYWTSQLLWFVNREQITLDRTECLNLANSLDKKVWDLCFKENWIIVAKGDIKNSVKSHRDYNVI